MVLFPQTLNPKSESPKLQPGRHLLAKNRGLRVTESTVPANGKVWCCSLCRAASARFTRNTKSNLLLPERVLPSDGTPDKTLAKLPAQDVLKSLRVALGSSDTKFSAALGSDKRIAVTGAVKGAEPYLTRIGTFDVDLALRGNILLVRRSL